MESALPSHPESVSNSSPHSAQAFTLTEVLVATAVMSLASIAVASFFLFYSRSAATYSATAVANQADQLTHERLSQDIRQAEVMKLLNKTNLTLSIGTNIVAYQFSLQEHSLFRVATGGRQTLLPGCLSASFLLGHRHFNTTDYDELCLCTSLPPRIVEATWISMVRSNSVLPLFITNHIVCRSRHP